MVFLCQKDSYLKELSTIVSSCKYVDQVIVNEHGKREKVKGYEVILEDTVLFPEGGGQPDDRGKINEVDVLKVSRRGGEAVHFVTSEIPPGTQVHMTVDWERRFDHMQQHTGQHLITALAERMFGCATTSWNLGERTSFIELDTPNLSAENVMSLEKVVNEKILASTPVSRFIFEDKNDPELQKFRCRGLPDDHVGSVRVIEIEGVDGGTLCCGTHVSNLAHLQMIKLLFAEKGKKNKTNLHFVAGERILNYMSRSIETEKALTVLLKGPLEQQVELAEKAVKGFKTCQKSVSTLLRDLAVLEAKSFKLKEPKENILVYHRKEGDNEFMNILAKEINDEAVICFLTVGDEKGAGLFLISGAECIIKEIGPKIAEIIEGRGSSSRGFFQGKAGKLSQKGKAEKILREFIKTQSSES